MEYKIPTDFSELSNESKLLLSLVSYDAPSEDELVFFLQTNQIDWARFERVAVDSFLGGLAYVHLKKYSDYLSTSTLHVLQQYHLKVLGNEAILLNDYVRIMRKVNQEGIDELIPLKGIRIAERNYPVPGTRQTSDIDVLCPEALHASVLSCLSQLGYHVVRLPHKSKRHARKQPMHAPYKISNRRSAVDLHHQLIAGRYRFSIDMEHIYARCHAVHDARGFSHRDLHPVDHFIFICLHAYKHIFTNTLKFSGFADMRLVLQTELKTTTPHDLFDRAAVLGCQKEVELMLELYVRLFGVDHAVVEEVDLSDSKQVELLWKIVLNSIDEHAFSIGDKRRIFVQHRFGVSKEVTPDAFLLWHDLFPSSEFIRLSTGEQSYWKGWRKRKLNFFRKISGKSTKK
jgi:hypothetical protein